MNTEVFDHIHDLEDMLRDLSREMTTEERVQAIGDAIEKTHLIQKYLCAMAVATVKRRDGELC